jgi:hypothetical protein
MSRNCPAKITRSVRTELLEPHDSELSALLALPSHTFSTINAMKLVHSVPFVNPILYSLILLWHRFSCNRDEFSKLETLRVSLVEKTVPIDMILFSIPTFMIKLGKRFLHSLWKVWQSDKSPN